MLGGNNVGDNGLFGLLGLAGLLGDNGLFGVRGPDWRDGGIVSWDGKKTGFCSWVGVSVGARLGLSLGIALGSEVGVSCGGVV